MESSVFPGLNFPPSYLLAPLTHTRHLARSLFSTGTMWPLRFEEVWSTLPCPPPPRERFPARWTGDVLRLVDKRQGTACAALIRKPRLRLNLTGDLERKQEETVVAEHDPPNRSVHRGSGEPAR